MEWLLWIGGFIVAMQVGDGISHIIKAYAKRVEGHGSKEIDAMRDEVRALTQRLDTTERLALEAEDKVRFLEGLLAAPAGSRAELPRAAGEETD